MGPLGTVRQASATGEVYTQGGRMSCPVKGNRFRDVTGRLRKSGFREQDGRLGPTGPTRGAAGQTWACAHTPAGPGVRGRRRGCGWDQEVGLWSAAGSGRTWGIVATASAFRGSFRNPPRLAGAWPKPFDP